MTSRALASLTASAAAVGCLAWGAWIPAKAALAQVLIDRSFDRALATGTAPPPWPWADTTPVARLRVPRLGIRRLVLAGAGGAPLAFGPGHHGATPLPGEHGNALIAGHRDTHFAFLAELAVGDELEVETADASRVRYIVQWLRVVAADATWVAAPTTEPALTLVTCYPFDGLAGHASERFVVRALADGSTVAARTLIDLPPAGANRMHGATVLW